MCSSFSCGERRPCDSFDIVALLPWTASYTAFISQRVGVHRSSSKRTIGDSRRRRTRSTGSLSHVSSMTREPGRNGPEGRCARTTLRPGIVGRRERFLESRKI